METFQTWIHYQATINDLKAQNAKLVGALKMIRECQDIARARMQARAALKEIGE